MFNATSAPSGLTDGAEYLGCTEAREKRRACFDDLSSLSKSGIIISSRHMCDRAADLNSQSAIGATYAPFSRPQFMAGVMSALRSTELWLGLQLHDTCHPLPSRWPPPEGTAMSELTAERLRELLDYDPKTGNFTWLCSRGTRIKGEIAGSRNPEGYIQIRADRGTYRAHRLAWLITHGVWPTNEIDHINGDRSDNRLENLRDVSRTTNSQNMRVAGSCSISGIMGAHWDETSNKFRARIRVAGKMIYLGRYTTPEEAHQAYVTAKRKLHEGNTL